MIQRSIAAWLVMGMLLTGWCGAADKTNAAAVDPVFLRVTVESIEPMGKPVQIRLGGYQKVWQRIFDVGLSSQGQVVPINQRDPWAALEPPHRFQSGKPGQWIDVSDLFADYRGPAPARTDLLDPFYGKMADPRWSKVLTVMCRIPDDAHRTGQPPDRVALRLELATRPNPRAVAVSLRGEVDAGPWTVLIPRMSGNLKQDAAGMATLQTQAQDRLAGFEARGLTPTPLAKRMLLSSWVKTWPNIYDRRTALTEARTLRLLGVNVQKGLAEAPGVTEAMTDAIGVSTRFFEHGGPPKEIRQPFRPDLREAIATWLGDRRQVQAGDPAGPVSERVYVKLEDEPHLFGVDFHGTATQDLASPQYAEAFQRWLSREGVEPSELGLKSLDEARPYPIHREMYRSEIADDHDARRAYLTAWFLQDATAHYFEQYVAGVRDSYGENVLTATCVPYITYRPPWFTFTYRPDHFLWSRRGVMDLQLHHYSRNDWQTAEELLLYGDLLSSAAKFGKTQAGVLWGITSRHDRNPTASNELAGMSALIRGVRNFYQYYYAPTQQPWTDDIADAFAAVGRIYRLGARIEDLLLDGDTPAARARVAVLHSRGSEIWSQIGVYPEERMLAGALAYRQTPVDILPEEEATARLDDYRVIYLTAPNLAPQAQDALVEWVKGGGVLFTVADAGTRDELDRPSPFLSRLLGKDATIELTDVAAAPFNEISRKHAPQTLGRATWMQDDRRFEWEVVGKRERLEAPGSRLLARFNDGGAAAIEKSVGTGVVIRIASLPGVALARTATPAFTDPVVHDQRDYDPRLIDLLLYPVERAGIEPELSVSAVGVDATWYELDGRAVVLMADYRATRGKTVDVRARFRGRYDEARTEDGRLIRVVSDGEWTVLKDVPLETIQAVFLTASN